MEASYVWLNITKINFNLLFGYFAYVQCCIMLILLGLWFDRYQFQLIYSIMKPHSARNLYEALQSTFEMLDHSQYLLHKYWLAFLHFFKKKNAYAKNFISCSVTKCIKKRKLVAKFPLKMHTMAIVTIQSKWILF